MTQEALKLALEALKGLKSMYGGNGHKLHEINMIHRKHDTAITALEKALAQPEQEPVISKWVLREVYFDGDGEPIMHRSTPQRKPLTDEEIINKCLESGFERNCLGWSFTYGKLDYHLLKLARAIEAAHGIKE